MNKEQLNERFEYKDGNLIYKIKNKNAHGINIGDVVGTIDTKGYRVIKINKKVYKAHRLIWIYHNGDIEDGLFIDHIDRNPLNNKIENLRLATRSQNGSNATKNITNTSGYKGVSWHKRSKKWMASIKYNCKTINIGGFSTAELASEAYKVAAIKYKGDYACWE